MFNIKFIFLKIYLLNFISRIFCQFEVDSMSRAIACMTIVGQKYEGRDPEAAIYSTMMLKCFISISDLQVKKVVAGVESGKNILSKKEIEKLTDYESLRDMSQNELQKRSNELERALKKFRKIQEQFSNGEGLGDIDPSEYDDEYDDDDNFDTETPSNINFFSLIPKGIAGIFNILNSYISLFLVFVIVYFGLLMLRKINDSEKKMKKKKKMMEKRMNDEFDEEEDEEYETQVYEKNKKGSKKMKRK